MANYPFTLTAGDLASSFQGYAKSGDYFGIGPLGSISGEPIAGQTLNSLFSGVASYAIFDGNITATLSGHTIWINAVEYPFTGSNWAYDAGDNITYGTWTSGAPVFSNGVGYPVQISNSGWVAPPSGGQPTIKRFGGVYGARGPGGFGRGAGVFAPSMHLVDRFGRPMRRAA